MDTKSQALLDLFARKTHHLNQLKQGAAHFHQQSNPNGM